MQDQSTLCYQVLKAKYFSNGDLLGAKLGTNPSMVWRGVMAGLGVLKKGSFWRIRDGASVRLWRDPWVPDFAVLSSFTEDRNIEWDARGSSLMDTATLQWHQAKLRQLFPTDIVEKISAIPLSTKCTHDRLIWWHVVNGRFTVKLAYRCAWDAVYGSSFNEYHALIKPVWSAVWHMETVPKIKHFLWKFICEISPTRVALQHRRVDCVRECCICDQAEESNYHLFFTCHWSKQVWAGSCPFFALNNIRSEAYLDDFLNSFLTLRKEQQERVAVTLWCIWSNRNNSLFQSRCSIPTFTVRWISKYIREYTVAAENGSQFRQTENRSLLTVWQPPQGDTIKINTDAAVPQNQSTTSLGVVLRNRESKVLGATVQTCNFKGTVLQAKVMAIEFALQIGKEFGCTNIEIESDSTQAVMIVIFLLEPSLNISEPRRPILIFLALSILR
ncbi:hypothetical protein SLA2020_059090 [Shorea laevis]